MKPGALWAKRRCAELGGCYAVRIGAKWFAVRGEQLVEVQQSDLLEKSWDGYGVAPC